MIIDIMEVVPVGKLELGWSTDIWDLAGDAPKLKWESVIVVE